MRAFEFFELLAKFAFNREIYKITKLSNITILLNVIPIKQLSLFKISN